MGPLGICVPQPRPVQALSMPPPEPTATTAAAPSEVPLREAALATTAGFLGWTLDAFDFFLVVISVPKIAKEFGVPNSDILLSVTLTLMFRPVGALIFGLLADRYGRRVPMMANLVFYSVVEVATGLAPGYRSFLILRALFGIGMGVEWGVGTSLVMEKVPPKWRGLLSGFLQEGYAAGNLLSAVAAYFMLDHYGWRSMFFVGGAPALLAVFIRFFVKESEVWKRTRARNWPELVREIGSHWKIWLYLTALMAMLNFSSHGTQDNYPTFIKEHRGMETQTYSKVIMIMAVGAIIGGVLFGWASDRFGRRRMMMIGFTGALLVTPWWASAAQYQWIVASAFLMQFMVQGAWGIIPAHISELAPDRVRGFLPGFSYQCGNLIAASIGWAQQRLAEGGHPYPYVMGVTAAVIFVMAIVVTGLGWERRGVPFGVKK
jgi:SHS family lactate transporter-like MFS transporter